MEAIREYLKKTWVWGVIGLVVGLFFGLVVLGWGLWPVKYYDAAPNNLSASHQQVYLRMAVDSYALTKNADDAKAQWSYLGKGAPDVLKAISTGASPDEAARIADFGAVVQALGVAVATQPAQKTPGPVTTPTPAQKSTLSKILPIFLTLCVITLALAAILVVIFLLRNRRGKTGAAPTAPTAEAPKEGEWAQYPEGTEEPPMAQFMASYKLGDDLFDDSFSIDSPSGEFLGECGVGISETIGVGDPKKVTAFEVWLFDKNDIQTVTKVVMSSHAFSDDTIRQRLAAKGEPIQATPGTQVVLETATLQLVSRVVDMAYGEGALPPESFFGTMVLELAVWQK